MTCFCCPTIYLSFIHEDTYSAGLLVFYVHSVLCMTAPHFIYPFSNWHCGCFKSLAIINDTAMSGLELVFMCARASLKFYLEEAFWDVSSHLTIP